MKEPKWWQHIYWSIKHGEWYCGFETKAEWPNKKQFGLFVTYYDGWHWAFHLGGFYIGASYY